MSGNFGTSGDFNFGGLGPHGAMITAGIGAPTDEYGIIPNQWSFLFGMDYMYIGSDQSFSFPDPIPANKDTLIINQQCICQFFLYSLIYRQGNTNPFTKSTSLGVYVNTSPDPPDPTVCEYIVPYIADPTNNTPYSQTAISSFVKLVPPGYRICPAIYTGEEIDTGSGFYTYVDISMRILISPIGS